MKTRLAAVLTVSLGLWTAVRADLILDEGSSRKPITVNSIQSYPTGGPGFSIGDQLRLDKMVIFPEDSPSAANYEITTLPSNGSTYVGPGELSSHNRIGAELVKLYVFDASHGANLWVWQTDAAPRLSGGPRPISTPATGGSGVSAAISRMMLVHAADPPSQSVPDGGRTGVLMLIGLVPLSVLGSWRGLTAITHPRPL